MTVDDLRAWSGLEACAHAVAHAVDAVAVVGGEGARRFAHALAAVPDARAKVLSERDEEAASAAVGVAAAGGRVALVLSGREAASRALPALRELAALRCAALVVVPAHGDERGRAVPEGPYDDLALLCEAPVGVLVASAPEEVGALTLAACGLASGAAMPWCVVFELARVGCAVGAVEAPARGEVAGWWRDDAVDRSASPDGAIARAWERVTARLPHVAPVTGTCAPGRDAWVRVGGDPTATAPTVALTQLRPFPSAEIAEACRGAASVSVCEPWPDAFGARDHGRLTTQVRAALAGLVARVNGLASGAFYDDTSGATARVRLACNEPARGAIVRACVGLAASLGWGVRAEHHEPWAATLVLRAPDAAPMEPREVLVAAPDALGLLSVIHGVEAVVLLGPCDGPRLREVAEACAANGATLRHEPDALLGA